MDAYRTVAIVTLALLMGIGLQACNTMAGLGQDVEDAGGAIEEEAED